MRRLAWPILLASLLALVVGVAACGDDESTPGATVSAPTTTAAGQQDPTGGEVSGSADQERPDGREPPAQSEQPERPLEVEDVLVAVLTDSGSPELACGELVTEAFLRDAYGGRANCLAARAQGGVARDIEITDVTESGASASAVAVPTGGPYDGVDVEVALVAETEPGRGWLVDSLFADVPAGP